MSAFIGPIHYWLFGKIRLLEERQAFLLQNVTEMCGSTAEEFHEQVTQMYGKPLPDQDLAELISHDNIHGWLQRQINLAESREASFIKLLLETCGGAAEDLVERSYDEHGQKVGASAKETGRYALDSSEGVLQAMNDYYLNGMPCDSGDCVMSLHMSNWKRAGMDETEMSRFYEKWLKSFVLGFNPGYEYAVVADAHQLNKK